MTTTTTTSNKLLLLLLIYASGDVGGDWCLTEDGSRWSLLPGVWRNMLVFPVELHYQPLTRPINTT